LHGGRVFLSLGFVLEHPLVQPSCFICRHWTVQSGLRQG
jgi:hypothetical protein